MSKDPGATLGPGPKAGPEGVEDNYYVKKFKYKLVPKDKNGNYVQKGSDLEVLNLFENEFQNKRVDAFNSIEKDLNNIYKLISNAKNETIKYYNDNPESFRVYTPTDLIKDYLNDIKKLLKGKE